MGISRSAVKASAGALAVLGLAGCVTYHAVPLQEGAFARGAVQVGEEVRVQTSGGEELAFTVAGVQEGALTGDEGERIAAGDLQSLEVRSLDKRKTIVALSVLGGVVLTGLLIDEAHHIEDCLAFDSCD